MYGYIKEIPDLILLSLGKIKIDYNIYYEIYKENDQVNR